MREALSHRDSRLFMEEGIPLGVQTASETPQSPSLTTMHLIPIAMEKRRVQTLDSKEIQVLNQEDEA